MIRLFVSDIDGCLAEPYCAYALDHFVTLAALAQRAGAVGEGELPAFSLCSGRAYAYVEAVTQVLGLQAPVLFESGGGLFDPAARRVFWNPRFTDALAAQLEEVRHWMVGTCEPGTSMMYDYGKRTQAGLIGPDPEEVARYVLEVEAYVAERFPGLRVFHTDVSIDVVPAGITKRQGMDWLAERTGVPLSAMAFIGDTNGDIEALQAVGYAFAPENAAPAVKRAAGAVTRGGTIEGVIEAYRWCVARHEANAEQIS